MRNYVITVRKIIIQPEQCIKWETTKKNNFGDTDRLIWHSNVTNTNRGLTTLKVLSLKEPTSVVRGWAIHSPGRCSPAHRGCCNPVFLKL